MEGIKIVTTKEAPAAIGPYSQAVIAAGMVFVSGQIALDPVTNEFVEGNVSLQTRQVLDNLRAVLTAAGADLDHVVKTTVFLADMKDFAAMNHVYQQYFRAKPARATVGVARLPKNALIEIDCIAVLPVNHR